MLLSKLRHMTRAARLMFRLRRRYGVRGPGLMGTVAGGSALSIVYTSRHLQPCAGTFDDRFCFVGPLLEPRAEGGAFPWESIRDRTVVYVSLGTLFNAEPGFYRDCFTAFASLPAQVVLSVGRRIPIESLGPPPGNTLVCAHVPQLELLQRASAFVTHGGMNSVGESLFNGVPLVVIPHMSEQEVVGRRVEELGAGLFVAREEVTPARLRESVDRLLRDPEFAVKARAIGESLRAAGGAARAAEAIQAFARVR